GEATCSVRGTSKARFEAGGFFGEMALLDGGLGAATVIAETPKELVVFTANQFRAMLDSSTLVRPRLLVGMGRPLPRPGAAACLVVSIGPPFLLPVTPARVYGAGFVDLHFGAT